MDFNLAEKLAIVKAIDNVILADKKIAKGELVYLGQLMKLLNFDSEFVEEARKFNMKQANIILEGLSKPKKHSLAIMLHEMAYADGDMNPEEIKLLFSIFEKAGIEIEEASNSVPVFNISEVYFKSTKHIQHYKEKDVSDTLKEKIAIKVEPNIHGKNGVSVTTFKLNGFIPFWGNKVELTPRQMKIVEAHPEKSILQGYDDHSDPGIKHSNYRLTIYHPNNEIESIVLQKLHKKIEIEYLK
ncbi:hypothetical protein [Christiangramia echinicola]|uniref:tellurite resistance TerB family protein n=1 Tax=Christiangramia echinicola TaxID=279359 RepID=UPI00041C1A58|nr:hypothetical protein [Christiangramia echinicola]